MMKTIVYLIISAASVVIAYGKPVEIKGYGAVVLWLAVVVFMILKAKRNIGLFRAAFVTALTCFVISSGLFFLRSHGSVKVVRTEQSGSSVVEFCDIDPGAMGCVRCRRTEYYNVIDNKLLSVRVPKSVKFYNGRYGEFDG